MNDISNEYAAALFMLASENNKTEEYNEALQTIKNLFEENPEYIDFLKSRSIPASERLKALEEAFSGNVPEDVLSYVSLLCEKNRIDCFFDSVDVFADMYRRANKISYAVITSAVPLTDDEKAALKKKLESVTGSAISAEYSVDKSLIGGVVAEIDGKIIDGSIKGRLRNIKEVIDV